MINTENPNFEDEFEAEIKTKEQRFSELKSQLSANNKFKARLANRNLQIAPYIPSSVPAGMGLIGQDIESVDPAVLKSLAFQVQNQDKNLWDSITDKFKGVTRGVFLAADAGLDFVKGQLLGRFPVEIGQRFNDKLAEGKSRTVALGEVFDEFDDIRKKVGDTAFTMAIREASRGREINLGEGIIPQSTPINETDEYKELVKRGVAPEKALELAQDIVGKPITDIAREQAISGVQFRGETRAGLEQAGYTPEVTLGRLIAEPLVAMNVIEPGTKGYRNLSGSVDFVGTLALDPANWVTLGAASVAKGARSIKFLDEAQKAQQIAEYGGITGGLRKTVIEKFPKLGGFSVEGFLQSDKGVNLRKFLVSGNTPEQAAGNVDYLSSLFKTKDLKTLNKIAKSSDEQEMFGLLTDYFGKNINQKIPFSNRLFSSYTGGAKTKRTQQLFSKITGTSPELANFGVGPALRYSGKWSPSVRLFSKLYEPGLDPTDIDGSLVTLQNMMRQMDLPADTRAKILSETIDSLDQLDAADDAILKQITLDEPGVAFEAFVDPLSQLPEKRVANSFAHADILFQASVRSAKAFKDELAKKIDDDLLSETIVNEIVSIYEKPLKEAGLYFVDEVGQAFNFGDSLKAYVNGSPVDIPTFRLSTELAQNYIPVIPASKVVKATNVMKNNILNNTPLKSFAKTTKLEDGAVKLLADKYISSAWKPAVLLRGAWTTRVIAEEQIRMWGKGYNSLVSPRRLVALATGKEVDPTGTLQIVRKIEQGVPDTEIENLIFKEFPNLPKRFKYQGKEISMLQAMKKYWLTGDKDLLDIVELTSKETKVMEEFFDAISGTHRGYQGLRQTNPSYARKAFSIFDKNDNPRGYVDALMTEYQQLLGDKLAVLIINEGPQAAKDFLWKTRYDTDSLARTIARQDPYYENIFTNQDLSSQIVDYINARITVKTGGAFNKETMEIVTPGNADLLNILRNGIYKEVNLNEVGSTKNLRKQYQKIFDDNKEVLPQLIKGRGGTYSEFASKSELGQKYDQVIENMFYFFMTSPTNKLSRAPVFKQAYWNKVTDLIAISSAEVKDLIIQRAKSANVADDVVKKMQKTVPASEGKAFYKIDEQFTGLSVKELALKAKGKLDTTPFKKFDDAFNSIDDVSKAHALNETKELLYDLGQRTRFWEATRLIFPFGEAYQEILTTWFKILRDNPAPIRRFQLTVEKGRETNPFEIENTDRGFFYEDPTTGEEMFAFPGWGGLASKFMGIEGDDPIQLEASGFAASVNLIGQSFLPGFGPLVQVPAAYLTKDVDPESTLVTAIFGDFPPEPTTNPFDYFTRLFPYPSWLKKVIQAYDLDPDEYGRLQTNTTIDVYNALYYNGRVSDGTYDEWKEGFDLAKEYAKTLTLIRAAAQFIGPTGFVPRWEVMSQSPEGRQVIFVTAMADDYRERLEQNNGDQFKTTEEFIQQYGIDPTSLFVGKSSQIYKRPVTIEGSKFYNDNKELFEEYKSTAYFVKPDDPTGEFSYEAYLNSIEEKARQPLTLEQWRLVKNNILGSMAWEQFMLSEAPGMKPYWLRSDDQAQADKDSKRMQLKKQYPGWGYDDIPGVGRGASVEVIIEEFYNWKNNPILSESEAGKGLALYLKARDNAKMESERLGYGPESFRTARALGNIRLYLNDYANYVIEQYPDFQYIWNSYFKRELLEAERDEQINATIRSNY
jgi:hypothetical protein